MRKNMTKYLFIAAFTLLSLLQTPEFSYSKESETKLCMGDCMVVHPEEKQSEDRQSEDRHFWLHRFPEQTYPKIINPKEPDIEKAFKDIFFDPDQFAITDQIKKQLKNVSGFLDSYPNLQLEIQGHSNKKEGDVKEIKIGDKRANAVKNYLISLGVDRQRLITASFGSWRAICHKISKKCSSNSKVHINPVDWGYIFKDIYFDSDQFTLNDQVKDQLKPISEYLNRSDLFIEIQGHCDERGSNIENIARGEKRADAVKDHLVSLGIKSQRLFVTSYGEEKPDCFESNEKCWVLNNRIHFQVLNTFNGAKIE
jgi:outer membrane protein OmpA-like peptidoglycan-associated protein